MATNCKLQELNLSHCCHISDDMVQEIMSQSRFRCTVIRLNMHGVYLSQDAFDMTVTLPHLRVLELFDTERVNDTALRRVSRKGWNVCVVCVCVRVWCVCRVLCVVCVCCVWCVLCGVCVCCVCVCVCMVCGVWCVCVVCVECLWCVVCHEQGYKDIHYYVMHIIRLMGDKIYILHCRLAIQLVED